MFAIRLLAIPLLILGCQHTDADTPAPAPKPKDWTPLDDKAALLKPIQVDSLTLTPIVATGAIDPKAPDIVTLDEAFGQKLLAIKEKEDESVNQLTLTNKSDRQLFLLAGEVIIGGKQDRIIGQNTIIAANTTQVVPVFCVEHGRWDNSSKVFTSGKALAHGRLRGRASYSGQGEVWQEVASKNEKRNTKSATDTYRGVAQQQQNGTLAASEQKVKAAIAKIDADDRERMIGYVVTVNGKVVTVDRFGWPKLFKKLEDKLVKSYLTESIDVVATKDNKSPTVADVKTFMADADKAVEEKSYDNPAATTLRYKGAKAGKARVYAKDAPSDDVKKVKEKPAAYENYQAE
jgi:hypothetical protein